jgi:ankyrin repeat protein
VNAYGGKYGTALHAAVFNRDVEVSQELLRAGADVNDIHEGHYGSILHCACMIRDVWNDYDDIDAQRSQLEIVRFLLAHNADVNARGGLYGNPLQAAAHYVGPKTSPSIDIQASLLQLLLLRGASPHIIGGKYGTALQALCAGARSRGEAFEELTDLLLQNMTTEDINAQEGIFGSCLISAIVGKSERLARLLIARGADVNTRSGLYGYAVDAALRCGYMTLARELIEIHKAKVDPQTGYDGEALAIAVATGDMELVTLLLNHGASVTSRTQLGGFNALEAAAVGGNTNLLVHIYNSTNSISPEDCQRALHAAVLNGSSEAADFLVQKGGDIDAPSPPFQTPIQGAIISKRTDMIDALLSHHNVSINHQSGFYGTALQAAVSIGEPKADLVRKFLILGADPNLQGGCFGTALQAAAVKGDIETVDLLLDHGANVEIAGGPYGTCLHAAVFSGDAGVILRIVEAGGNVNALDNIGQTPLHLAVVKHDIFTVNKLLQQGARADLGDRNGHLPVQLAIFQRDYRIAIKLLPESGPVLSDIPASEWRSTLPGPFNSHLEIVAGDFTTVAKRLDPSLRDGNFPLLREIRTQTHQRRHYMLPDNIMPYEEQIRQVEHDYYKSMAAKAQMKRILYVPRADTLVAFICETKHGHYD